MYLLVILMKRSLSFLFALWLALAPAAAQFGSGGAQTTNNTAAGATRVLCSIRSANFNSTADQVCTIPAGVTAWVPTSIIVTNCSASLTLAAGGVYPATSKGGTALVAAAQIYTALTGATIVFGLTLAANIATTRYTVNSVYLALTTGQGTSATCDFFLIGNDLS
jgi:hypothetical protein